MTCIRSEIIGHGHYQPAKVLTNDDMAKIVETSDEWITERTGIKSRHIAADGELTSDLALHAAEMALKNAGIGAEELDLVVVGTVTPDNTFPAVATKIAAKLGCRHGVPAFDLSAACSGFVYSLTMADNMVRLGQAKTDLVIGAETLSRVTDWTDRNTCVLFGDGAGAVVIRACEGKGDTSDRGVLSTKIFSDGAQYDNLYCKGGVSSTQTAGFTFMNGKEVFKRVRLSLTPRRDGSGHFRAGYYQKHGRTFAAAAERNRRHNPYFADGRSRRRGLCRARHPQSRRASP